MVQQTKPTHYTDLRFRKLFSTSLHASDKTPQITGAELRFQFCLTPMTPTAIFLLWFQSRDYMCLIVWRSRSVAGRVPILKPFLSRSILCRWKEGLVTAKMAAVRRSSSSSSASTMQRKFAAPSLSLLLSYLLLFSYDIPRGTRSARFTLSSVIKRAPAPPPHFWGVCLLR